MVINLILLYGLVILAVAVYYYLIWNYDFWKKRGIPGPKPQLFFGTQKDAILAKVTLADILLDACEKYRSVPAFGLYDGRSPILVLQDPEIIKRILIKDFLKFTERTHRVHARTEPTTLNLFNLDTERWRYLRQKQSPMFSSVKLKGIFNLMIESSEKLEKYLDQVLSKNEVVEVNDVTTKFAADVIGSYVFGINTNILSSEDTEFHRTSKTLVERSFEKTLRIKLKLFLPKIYDLLGFVWPERKYTPFFTKVVMETISYRKKNNIHRTDIIQMLMDIRDSAKNQTNFEFSDTMLMAQAAGYFGAGLDTVSSALNWALLELALNSNIQNKLREEIEEYIEKYNGEITYESLKQLVYLDKVIKETLRKHSIAPVVMRKSDCDYYFESLNFSVPKSTEIWVPIYALHRDPSIYPDPIKFDPERFSKEAVAARHPMYYLPFGAGPRNCIGNRLAIFEMKLFLLKIFQHWKVGICEQTKLPYEREPGSLNITYKGRLYLKVTPTKY